MELHEALDALARCERDRDFYVKKCRRQDREMLRLRSEINEMNDNKARLFLLQRENERLENELHQLMRRRSNGIEQ